VKYFFDNCISHRYADMLCALDVDAKALRHEFAEDIDDISLFRELHGRDVVFVTYDSKQRTRVLEAREIKAAGITTLWIEPFWGKMKQWDQATWLVKRWPLIDAFAGSVVKGTCAIVKQNGKCEMFQL